MDSEIIQTRYPDGWNHCYGCGQLNGKGLKVESRWDGDETVCTFSPRPEHTAIPGFVYGGLIASVIDCHSTGTAAAARHRADGRRLGDGPIPRFLTGRLTVDYLKPTPLDAPMELRSRIVEVKGRKVVVATELRSKGELCARGEVVAIQVPDSFALPAPAGGGGR